MTSPTRSTIAWMRCGRSRRRGGAASPCSRQRNRFPLLSTTPKPVRTLPGSTPSTRIVSLRELGKDFVGNVEVGEDLLDVVVLLQRVHQLQELPGILRGHRHDLRGHAGELGAQGRNALLRERFLHRLERRGRREYLEAVAFRVDVVRAG